jgi:hypothetical protein
VIRLISDCSLRSQSSARDKTPDKHEQIVRAISNQRNDMNELQLVRFSISLSITSYRHCLSFVTHIYSKKLVVLHAFPTLKGLRYSAPILLTNRTCHQDVIVVNRARPLFHLSQSSHGRRERSNTCCCRKIYCLLTLFAAGLRQNTVFSFTLAESPLLFSLTHPARAGQQLEWTCDRTSEPPQV